MKEIRALLFDFGGTLDGNGIHWRERTYQFIRDRFPEIVRQAFDQADRAAVEQFVASGEGGTCSLRETADAIATGIYKALGLELAIKEQYVDRFCEAAGAFLDRNREWLAKLQKNYRLGVISNNFGNTKGWCDEYNLSPLLDVVIDSSVCGVWKPDAQIFHAALSELGVSAEKAIYVGDTYSHDIVGAKGVGMWAAWLVGDEKKECPNLSIVDVKLTEIQELESFLSH